MSGGRSPVGLPFWPEQLDHGFARAASPGQIPLDGEYEPRVEEDPDDDWDDDPDAGGRRVWVPGLRVTATTDDGEPVL